MTTAQELPIDTTADADDMAQAIFGEGVEVVSATYTGAAGASGIYSDGDSVAPGVTPSDTGVILSTGSATAITNSSGDANAVSWTSTNNHTKGDSDLDDIAGSQTYDAAVLEADFVPKGDTLTMQVTFSSEEYLEYVDSGFNDAVGIFVNGEQAELTVGDGDITINNINDESNSNLYVDNPASAEDYNTEMDGFTVTLTLKAPVNAGEENHIKIAIADGGDASYDSNLLIAGDSVQCALIAGDDDVTVHGDGEMTVDVTDNDVSATGATLSVTKINGVEVQAGDSVTLPSGETITLNDDGTLTFEGDGDPGISTLSYTVADDAGNTDVGYINLTTTAACFTAGTWIDTPTGPVPIERLSPGDEVVTRDCGPQTLLWVGVTLCRAAGVFAPVRLDAGVLGATCATEVSPNHRLLVDGTDAELLFAQAEVLVRAQDLVNGTTITRREDGGRVAYVHLLFESHQIVRGDGVWSESYQPGDQSLGAFDADTRSEILALFPELARRPDAYGPTARPVLRRFEAALLAGAACFRRLSPPAGPCPSAP